MKIDRAVITAAGKSQRNLPLQTVIDRDGNRKTVLSSMIDEVTAAGVEKIALVVRPGDQGLYSQAAGELVSKIEFVEQTVPRGYGDAVLCARDFVGNHPFLLLVSDHLFVSDNPEISCVAQLIKAAEAEGCAVSAVQATHESKLPYFGAVGGEPFGGKDALYTINTVQEKPTPTVAEQTLVVPGMRPGHYLCFFGMHVLTPEVFGILAAKGGDKLGLSPALCELAEMERYLALEMEGRRFDLEGKHGLLMAQLAMGLDGKERDQLLSSICDLLAHTSRR